MIEAFVNMIRPYNNPHPQEQRAATRENVERRLARTADELAEEESGESDVSDGGEASDDEETVPYNPKNLPIGWDGKPIPYWLYKLHGLNLTYNCEICGNAIYKGPKNFQRHFSVSYAVNTIVIAVVLSVPLWQAL